MLKARNVKMEIKCDWCKKSFLRNHSSIVETHNFCSNQCCRNYTLSLPKREPKPSIKYIRKCSVCNTQTFLSARKLRESYIDIPDHQYLCLSCSTIKRLSLNPIIKPLAKSKKYSNINSEYNRNCPNCEDKLFYSSKISLDNAIRNNSFCKNCSHTKTKNDFCRECPTCSNLIFYTTAAQMRKAERKKRVCLICSSIKTKVTRAVNGNKVISKKKIIKKENLGLNPNEIFLERICPLCKVIKITYSSERTALDAERKGSFCRDCTFKTTQCFGSKVSKLELSLVAILQKFGFEHSSNREFPYLTKERKYTPDFINQEQKIIIEINGDFWHCNPMHPKFGNPNYFHPSLKLTSKQVWEKEEHKNNFYKKNGFKVITIWEDEIKKTFEKYTSNPTNKTTILFLSYLI